MNARTLMTILVLPLLAVAAYGQPEDAQLRRELQAYYAQIDKHVAAGDCDAIMRMMDPGLVLVDTEGNRASYADMKAMVEEIRKSMKGAKSHTAVKHVRRQGSDEAVAWIEMTMHYRTNQNGKWVPVKSTHRYAETLRRTPSGWKVFYAQELPTNEPWSFKTGG